MRAVRFLTILVGLGCYGDLDKLVKCPPGATDPRCSSDGAPAIDGSTDGSDGSDAIDASADAMCPVSCTFGCAPGGSCLPCFAELSGDKYTFCVRRFDGAAFCSGLNDVGQLTRPPNSPQKSDVPVQVQTAAGAAWTAARRLVASSSATHACVLQPDSSVWCWGDNDSGELGNGTTNSSPPRGIGAPVQVLSSTGGQPFFGSVDLALGGHHTCALKGGGALWCWGYNAEGQVGNGMASIVPVTTPLQVLLAPGAPLTNASQVVAGDYYTCALVAGEVLCWGDNSDGQLGVDPSVRGLSATPVQVIAGGIVELSAGHSHVCARRTDSGVVCWGRNNSQQLGEPGAVSYDPRPFVALASGATHVFCGGEHSCATKTDRSLWCWGRNQEGELGMDPATTPTSPAPVQVFAAAVEAGSAGGFYTCVRRTDGQLLCLGRNADGELGFGSTAGFTATPVSPMLACP